jgi:hypothetical protein
MRKLSYRERSDRLGRAEGNQSRADPRHVGFVLDGDGFEWQSPRRIGTLVGGPAGLRPVDIRERLDVPLERVDCLEISRRSPFVDSVRAFVGALVA